MPTEFIWESGCIWQNLTNILGKVVKFTCRGHVWTRVIGLLKDSREIDIRNAVEDIGLRVPQDDVSYLFCDFHKMEEAYSRKFDGTGLGLSMIQRLITFMNGAL